MRSFAGWVYVAFVLDVFSRRIVGWQVATGLYTELALDALEMVIWSRTKDGAGLAGLVRNKGSWRDIDHLEVAVAEWVDGYNHRRLHGGIGHVPPVEYEQLHAGQLTPELQEISN